MSPSRNHRCLQRPAMPIVTVLSLLLGLCLQPLSSSASPTDAVSTATGKPTQSSNRSNTNAARQSVAPAPGTPEDSRTPENPSIKPGIPEDKLRPAPKARAKSTLALTAETSAPRKQARPAKRKKEPELRMRQALERVADEREAEKRAQNLRDLLARAQLDYTEGRVFDPANNNALARYQEVLALDPAQPQALAATQRIADILAAEAEHVALAGDQARTLQYILQIRALQPKHVSLQGLDARYQALLANPVVLSARQQDRYSRSAQRIDEAYYLLRNQPAGARTVDQAIEEYDRARALVAQAPGLPKLADRITLAFPAATSAELADDAPRRALRLVQIARKRGWFSQELDPLEAQARKDIEAQRLLPPLAPRR